MIKVLSRLTFSALIGFFTTSAAAAAVEDFTNLSLEELMKVEVTTASKTPQTLIHTAAAAFVITQEDIRRSGTTNIPELLRMVPGIEVARVNAHTYAITARGFNGVYANKLLVLIDGRSVYTPLFSGVQWDLQDTMLEDIERIEVIRGPGGTLWGANAFNGVINIITKSAHETQGGLATAHGGTLQDGGAIRYGGRIDGDSAYRIWGKFDHHGSETAAAGGSAHDGFNFGRAGFRYDGAPSPDLRVLLEGGATHGSEQEIFQRLRPRFPFAPFLENSDTSVGAGHVLGRVTKATGPGEEWQFQSYLDWTDRTMAILREKRLTGDFEVQHSSHPDDRNHLIWGLGYRATTDWMQGTFDINFNPSRNTEQLANFFIQDEFKLIPNSLSLIVGSKFEYTNWSGFDIQPNLRLLWNPDPQQAVWAAVSRAVRTPSRAERDLVFNYTVLNPPLATVPTLVTVFGNGHMQSEKVTAFETGYRWQATQRINLDVAGFYNLYGDLGTVDALVPRLVGGLPNLPARFDNLARGHAYGLEFAGGWQAAPWLSFRSAYTFQRTKISRDPTSTDTTTIAYQNSIPKHHASLRASANLAPNVTLDATVRYFGRLNLSAANTALLTLRDINSYWALDLRLGWQATDRVLLELIGQNLNREKHVEFQDFGPTRAATAQIPRAAIVRATVQF
jgi:iron complex outermembrane recepter protein